MIRGHGVRGQRAHPAGPPDHPSSPRKCCVSRVHGCFHGTGRWGIIPRMGELFVTQRVRHVLNVFCFISSLKEDLKEETEQERKDQFPCCSPSRSYDLVTRPRAALEDAGTSDSLITTLVQRWFVVNHHLINMFWKFS